MHKDDLTMHSLMPVKESLPFPRAQPHADMLTVYSCLWATTEDQEDQDM